MADVWAENEDQYLDRKSLLFPIASTSSEDRHEIKEVKPLFPSVSGCNSREKELVPVEKLDWLSNDSYSEPVVKYGSKSEKKSLKLKNDQESEEYSSCSSLSSSEDETVRKSKLEKAKKKREKKLSKRHNKKHKKHKHKRLKVSEEEKLTKLPSTIWIEESGLEFDRAFRVHRKPDCDNYAFGGLYRLDIAVYKLNPKLKVLGSRPGQIVNFGQNNKKREKSQSEQRYWGSEAYVGPVHKPQLCKGVSDKGSSGFSDNFAYVPLELPSSVDENINTGQSSASEEPLSSELIARTKHLNQKVHENPSNTDAWLALADLQGQQVQYGNLTVESLNKSGLEKHQKQSKLALEKKAAVLEQAVDKNPSCVELIVAYLNVCMETMSSDKVLEKWKNTLFIQPQKTVLWKHYLMFCQSNFSAFSFPNTLSIYSKCFSTLSAIKDGFLKSHSPEADIEVGMVEIFVQFCQFLKQTGHTEKAVAAFQALLEFNFFHPTSLEENYSLASSLSFYETFWDSEEPRFGEDDACGWDKCMENNTENIDHSQISLSEIFSASSTDTKVDEQEKIISAESEKAFTWIRLETLREAKQWRPKKTSSDENDGQEDLDPEDPDRVVLFQDISAALFRIFDETLKFQLLCYFLAFLGIGTEVHSFECCTTVRLNNLIQVLLEDDKQLEFYDSANGCRFSCSWTQPDSFSTFPTSTPPAHRMFVRNIFSQALRAFSGDLQTKLVAYWLKFEQDILMTETNGKQRKQVYKSVRKLSKTLLKLKERRNNLRLWFALAEVEWVFGNVEEARRIVFSSLQQSLVFTSEDQNANLGNFQFVRLYCEMEMDLRNSSSEAAKRVDLAKDEQKNRILGCIAVVVGKNEHFSSFTSAATPSGILKTHRTLQEKSTQMLTDFHSWDSKQNDKKYKQFLVDFTICYALFEYWSLGIHAAQKILDSFLSVFTGGPSTSERKVSGSKYHVEVLVFYCRLLQFHCRYGICSVKPLRDLLLLALSIFPESAFFLHAYVSLELKACASTSVRRFFDRILPRAQTPVPWIYAILYERRRMKTILTMIQATPEQFLRADDGKPLAITVIPNSGVVHRLKSLFERAIVHPSSRNCVAIWRSYIKLEAENGDIRQAKAIFYQSLQCCAWAKVLYVDTLRVLPDFLQDLHDLMEEKELRIRAPLDEIDLLSDT